MGDDVVMAEGKLGYRPGLDGLRAVAVLAVFGRHAVPDGVLPGFGWVGVGLFFTLSGFLITKLLLEEWDRDRSISYRGFYLRRARRLLPALAAVFGVVWLMSGEAWWPAMFYGSNYAQITGSSGTEYLHHTWTLAVEEHFYLVWPLAFSLLAARGRLRWVGWLAVIFTVWRLGLWAGGADTFWLRRGTDTKADTLLIGCAAAVFVHQTGWRPTRRMIGASLALGVMCGFAFSDAATFSHTIGYALWGLASAVLIVASMDPPAWLASTPLRWIGKVSYGLYLWHVVFREALLNAGYELGTVPFVTLLTVLSAVATAVSWRLVESPWLTARRQPSSDRTHEPLSA